MESSSLPVAYADVAAASGRLAGHAHRTPVLTSSSVDARTGARVFFKCEQFQRSGAFKFRGAFNALAQVPEDARRRGVLTYSSGNHAQALALAGREFGTHVTVVMPDDCARAKLEATRGYGAEVVLYDKRVASRESIAARLASERGLALIPPFDHAHVIAGQGTAAKELFEDAGPLDYLFVPCGGGGLISGCALAARAIAPSCRVVGIEPVAGDDATRSFRSGTLQHCDNPETIADGARTASLGRVTFALLLALVHDMNTVSDTELLSAMLYLWHRMKIIVEPTGALGAAGLFERGYPIAGKRVGVMLSGGNADFAALAPLLRSPVYDERA